MTDISSAALEQSHGIEEVARVVAHLDGTTQHNSAMAEQSTTVARELAEANSALQQLVAGFKLGGDQSRSAAPSVQAANRHHATTTHIQPAAEIASVQVRKVANSSWTEF